AAADRDDALWVLPLARERVAEIGGELRVRLFPDRARVEDDDVRLVGRRRLTEAEFLEQALDPLGIVRVHLAAEGGDVVPAWHMKGPIFHGEDGSRESEARYLARSASMSAAAACRAERRLVLWNCARRWRRGAPALSAYAGPRSRRDGGMNRLPLRSARRARASACASP